MGDGLRTGFFVGSGVGVSVLSTTRFFVGSGVGASVFSTIGFFVGSGVGASVLSTDIGEGLGDGLPLAPVNWKVDVEALISCC